MIALTTLARKSLPQPRPIEARDVSGGRRAERTTDSDKLTEGHIDMRVGAVSVALLALLVGSLSFRFHFPKRRFRIEVGSTELDDEDFGERSDFRSSFISILGNPNVGKSTLLNALLGEQLCITSPKPQTTRHRILGVLTDDEKKYQFVFSDTPGMLKPAYALQETMATSVRGAVGDGDIIVLVTDVYGEALADEQVYQNIQVSNTPVVVVINKIDMITSKEDAGVRNGEGVQKTKVEEVLQKRPKNVFSKLRNKKKIDKKKLDEANSVVNSDNDGSLEGGATSLSGSALDQDQIDFIMSSNQEDNKAFRDKDERLTRKSTSELIELWSSRIPRASFVLMSASKGWAVDSLSQELLSLSPYGPKFFPSDTLTDRDERFFASEIIRESVLNLYSDEIPYSCEVRIEQFLDKSDNLSVIDATIVVSRESQKGIVIGKQGTKLKELGQEARHRLEKFLERGVYLNLRVKVDKDWRSSKESLEKFEYL